MSHKDLVDAAKQRPSFMELLHLLPPYTVDDVVRAYEDRTKKLEAEPETDPSVAAKLQSAYERALDHARFQESRRVWLGGRVEVFQHRQQLIAAIEEAGGHSTLQPPDSYLYEYGDDFAEVLRKLVAVHLTGPLVNDESLGWLGLENSALQEIRLLDLSNSQISENGLQELPSLTGLRCLDLRETGLPGSVVDVLSSLPSLEWVHVGGTSVGSQARRRLNKALPRLTIATKADEPIPPADGAEYEHLKLQRRLAELGMLPS